jgi:hypothetical protein
VNLDSTEDGEEQPYVLAWLHVSLQRLGSGDYENLAADASRLDHNTSLYPVVVYYLGQIDRTQLLTAADSGDRVGLPNKHREAYACLGEAHASSSRRSGVPSIRSRNCNLPQNMRRTLLASANWHTSQKPKQKPKLPAAELAASTCTKSLPNRSRSDAWVFRSIVTDDSGRT